MGKKIVGIICGISIVLCMLTGCTANEIESLTDVNVEETSSDSSQSKGRPKEELTEEMRATIETYNVLAREIAAKYKLQIQELTDKANAEIETIYEEVLGEEYIQLKNEYDGIYQNYQSLVQGFYGDENYIALKDELNAKISELAALTKGSEAYNAKLSEINLIWSQISVLAGEVNSQLEVLYTRALEIVKSLRSLEEGQKEKLKALVEPVLSQYALNIKNTEAAFMQELRLLQQALGLI